MKSRWTTLPLTALVLLFGAGIWTPSETQALDPAAEQISLIITFECGSGATNDVPPLCSDSVLMDADGSHVMRLPGGGEAVWSPDGKQFLAPGPVPDIFLVPATGGPGVNLTNHPATDLDPAWSPDGTKIAFASDRDGPPDLYLMNPDGSGVVRIITGVAAVRKPTWSPDGTRLAFSCTVDSSSSSNVGVCAINADGSGFARLTTELEDGGQPAWSPDGSKILFVTNRYGGVMVTEWGDILVSELVTMNPDGSGVTRLSPGMAGYAPAWSSDGTRIAFVSLVPTDWYGLRSGVSVMNADGSGVFGLAWGDSPAWRPVAAGNDRPVPSFTFACSGVTCTFDASASSDSDGTIAAYAWHFGDGATGSGASASHTFVGGAIYTVQLIVMDHAGALASVSQSVSVNQPPIVSFMSTCTGLTCTFDGSASFDPDGTIGMFVWKFGDGTDGAAPATVSHTYAAAGTYTVTLTATDTASGTGTQSQTITLQSPPVASFTYGCTGLTCTFDGSASSDPDGTITSHAWTFGDGTGGSGATVSHVYAVGIYTVTLTVTDNGGATGTKSTTVMLNQVHVGDLDRAITNQGSTWTAIATATVHDTGHGPVANATVSGSWSTGVTGSCTTTGSGQCTVSKPGIPKKTGSVTFTVAGVTHATLTYKSTDNHDPDGDSNGTSITVIRP